MEYSAKKLALGTVQFGLNYGINNSLGQVSPQMVAGILASAQSAGVDTLDTAFGYGNSEDVLGATGIEGFRIVSKLPVQRSASVLETAQISLSRLRCKSLYGYMFHNFSIYKDNPQDWEALEDLKARGLVQKIGCSLYSPDELEIFWKNGVELDIVQFPYNVFDRRFEPYFAELKERGTEVHTRSVFLQGLFFKNPETLPSFFAPIKDLLQSLHTIAQENNLPIQTLCLQFAIQTQGIDKVVIGVDSSAQLDENLNSLKNSALSSEVFQMLLDSFQNIPTHFINPSQWK